MRDEPPVEIVLGVPGNLAFQYVYRQRRSSPLDVRPVPGATFHYASSPLELAPIFPAVRRHFSVGGLLKTCLKLATPRRAFFCVILDGEIACDGWVMYGWCRNYRVEPEDAVIGPMETRPAQRGRGIATFGLASAVNHLIERGRTVTWIDSFKTNVASQKFLAHCGYVVPVAIYLRGYAAPEPPPFQRE